MKTSQKWLTVAIYFTGDSYNDGLSKIWMTWFGMVGYGLVEFGKSQC